MGVVTDVTVKGLTTAVTNISATGMSDTTGQAIVSAINGLSGAISPAASNVTFDNTGTGMTASNAQDAIEEVNDLVINSTASITRQSGVSSSTPIPTITRCGKVVIIHFAQQFPAGTYYELYDVLPLPNATQHAVVNMGSSQDLVIIRTDGRLRFNNSKTFSSNTYVIGQLVYLTN